MQAVLKWMTGCSWAVVLELGAARAVGAEPSAEAKQHYEHAVELYAQGRYVESLAEMRLVRDLSHSYKILYNMGQVHVAMKDQVGAIRDYEAYLSEGGAELTQERRSDVQNEIAALRRRVATLTLRCDVPDAEVLVDGSSFGPARRELVLNPGMHHIRVRAPQHLAQDQTANLGEGERLTLDFRLPLENAVLETPHAHQPRYVAWGVVAGLGAASIPFGIAALNAQHENATRARVFAGVCDALWISAAGLGVWLVLDPNAFGGKRSSARSGTLVLELGASRVSLRSSF